MAVLTREDGSRLTRDDEIVAALSALKIELARWPVGDDAGLRALLAKDALSDDEKGRVLVGLDGYFEQLKARYGYAARDLIVLHTAVEGLDTLLAKFEKAHTHADDEVRYIVDGEGVFGFVLPGGEQVELLVEAQEYINVPRGTEHWFHLTGARRIKAVRYFIDATGWVPEYTGTSVRFG